MFIKDIELTNFRNYDILKTDFNQNVNLILGNNAKERPICWKVSTSHRLVDLFRTNKDSDLVNFQKEMARIKVNAEKSLF